MRRVAPSKPERNASKRAWTRLVMKSLKMVLAVSGRFSRISWVSSPDLLASALKPSANFAFSSLSATSSWVARRCLSATASSLLFARLAICFCKAAACSACFFFSASNASSFSFDTTASAEVLCNCRPRF